MKRKPKPANGSLPRKSESVLIRLSAVEKERLRETATAAGKTMSAWIREELLHAASTIGEKT